MAAIAILINCNYNLFYHNTVCTSNECYFVRIVVELSSEPLLDVPIFKFRSLYAWGSWYTAVSKSHIAVMS